MFCQYVDTKLGKRGNSGGRRMSSNGEPIPLKSANTHSSNKNKGGGGGGGESNALRDNDKKVCIKECDLCVQWNPCTKGTHWTSDCTRFNKNGSCKESACLYGGAGDGGGGKPRYNKLLSKDLEKQNKKLKKLKKKYKRQKKCNKRGRDCNSSDSSSSSSSDGE